MSGTKIFTTNHIRQYQSNLNGDPNGLKEMGRTVADNVKKALEKYNVALGSKDPAEIATAEENFRNAIRSQEGFGKIAELLHSMLMKMIDRLNLR